ncbi:hypothetical protein ACHQM5_001718 [Ranunculus cassubicifolius]
MENSASFHQYEVPPSSPISDVLNLCMETDQCFDIDEIVGTSNATPIDDDSGFANDLESIIQGNQEHVFNHGSPDNLFNHIIADENAEISHPIEDSEFGAIVENFMIQGQENDAPGDEIVIPDDIFNGWLLGDNLDDLTIEGGQDDHSVIPSDFSNDGIDEERSENENTADYDIAKPLSVWPPQPVPYSCSFCQVLRVIVHSNGTYTSKLEIHGRVGIICHGILEMRHDDVSENPIVLQQMIDFSLRSTEDVKHYLTQYCEERKEAGYVMSQDPLSTYYSAICVGLDSDESAYTSEDNGTFLAATGLGTRPASEGNVIQFPPTSLSAQRARTGKLKLCDLVEYFHLPIEAAAKRLAICPTAIKKICRRNGLRRWPHRKIKSIERKLHKLEGNLRNKNVQDIPGVRAKIVKLAQDRDRLIYGMTK